MKHGHAWLAFVCAAACLNSVAAEMTPFTRESPVMMGYHMRYAPGVKGQAMDATQETCGNLFWFAVANSPHPFMDSSNGTMSFWLKPSTNYYPFYMYPVLTARDAHYMSGDGEVGIAMTTGYDAWKKGLAATNVPKYDLAAGWRGEDGIRVSLSAPATALDIANWFHVVLSWTPDTARLYINGRQVAEAPNHAFDWDRMDLLFFGSGYCVFLNANYYGQMDELMVFNRALSQEEVTALAEKKDLSAHPALVFYFPFDGSDQYKIKRHDLKERLPSRIAWDLPNDFYRYYPVGSNVTLTLQIPARAGLAGAYTAGYQIKNLYDDQETARNAKDIVLQQGANSVQSFRIATATCGVYRLAAELKDSKGAVVAQRAFDYAVRVVLPEAADISVDAPLACGPMVSGYMPEGRYLGFKWERVLLNGISWADIEQIKGKPYWGQLDYYVDQSLQAGHAIMVTVQRVPPWAADVSPQEVSDYVVSIGESKERIRDIDRHPFLSQWLTEYPPKDIKDWENFMRAMVRRYKGKVHCWEIWNEPNGKIAWVSNPGAYVELLKAAYQVIHEEDPQGIVVGADGAPDWYSWTQKVIEAGGAQYMDVLSLHNYLYDTPMRSAAAGRIEQVRKWLDAKSPDRRIPIWNTETGYRMFARVEERPMTQAEAVKKYGRRFVNNPDFSSTAVTTEHIAACWEVQAFLLDDVAGVDRMFLHGGHSVSFTMQNVWVPTEKGVAMAAMAKVVTSMKKASRIPTGSDSAAGVLVADKSGTRTAVVFADEPATLYFRVPAGTAALHGMDYLGNPLAFEVQDGLVCIEAGLEPVYIFGVPANFRGVEIIRAECQDVIKPEVPFEITVQITNPLDRPFAGQLSLIMPTNWNAGTNYSVTLEPQAAATFKYRPAIPANIERGVYELAIQLAQGGKTVASAKRRLTYFAAANAVVRQAARPIVMDGATNAWGAIPMETIGSLERLTLGRPETMFPERSPHWKGPGDLSFSVGLTWRFNDAIYFLLNVVDDKMHPAPAREGAAGYQWDCVELFFDGRPEALIMKNPADTTAPGVEHVRIFPSLSETAQECRVHYKTGAPSLDMKVIGKRTPQGYLMQGRIAPNAKSEFKIVPGTKFGLDIIVDDSDENNPNDPPLRKAALAWIGTEDNWHNAMKWGRFQLYLADK